MFVGDLQDIIDAKSVSVLDALHFLLAALSHVEGVAVAGVEVLDAEDGFLLQSTLLDVLLPHDGEPSEPHNGHQQQNHKHIAKANGEGVFDV